MQLYARQGDLRFEVVQTKLSKTASKLSGYILAGDSSGHRHRITGQAIVQESNGDVLVQILEPTEVVHEKAGGHKPVRLAPQTYLIRRLRERGDARDRAVTD